jgi:hypothetical protein
MHWHCGRPFLPPFPDSKRIHRALFGVTYEEDVYEKFCTAHPTLMRFFWWRIADEMRRRKLIFIHVPRAAGTSISRALFGARNTLHYSIRYYRTVHPRFFESAHSFAVLRDPFDRFLSSYAFVRAGGTRSCRMSAVFAAETARLRSIEDYLSYLEERDVMETDFVMRPQSWFITDLKTGAPLVKTLFLLQEHKKSLMRFLSAQGVSRLPRLNESDRVPLALSLRQKARVENLYAGDFALVDMMRGRQTTHWRNYQAALDLGLAAE